MSAPTITTPQKPLSKEQVISDIIESIALEETALAHIINAQAEKIQRAIECEGDLGDLIRIDAAISDVLKNVIKIQMLLQFRLEEIRSFMDC